jgi:hypothetical protein
MSAPSEPEKYSIDEMMERLKSRPAEDPIEDGELVTRADGSQAIRVRKRKRRSHQPHKEEVKQGTRSRMLQVSGALVLLMLALFAAGAAIVYANSTPFREGLVRMISESSGAKPDLKQFRMNPTSANAGGLTLTWPAGNALRNLNMRGIHAEISPPSFLGKSMVGEEVTAAEGELNVWLPQAGQPAREIQPPAGPLQIRFNHYAIPKFHFLLGDPVAPLIRMMNSEASFHPQNASGRAQLLFNRGDITINGWPKLRMDRSHIEFRGSEVDVVGLRLRHDDDTRGSFELSGTFSPYDPSRASTLAVQLESYPTPGIIGPQLGRLIAGRIDTVSSAKSNYLTFTPAPVTDTSLAVTFRNTITAPLQVSGFPFLFGLSQIFADEWFLSPSFSTDAGGVVRRADGNISLSDLNFEKKDWMALRGDLAMTRDHRISGSLQVGIAVALINATIQSTNNKRLDRMFAPPADGFRWITVKVSGTAAQPIDNFKDLFEAASSKEPTPSGAIPSFEDLTKPE